MRSRVAMPSMRCETLEARAVLMLGRFTGRFTGMQFHQ